MKILVTGTEGYIGARLAPWLHAAGHEVAGLDRWRRDLGSLGIRFISRSTREEPRTGAAPDFNRRRRATA